MPGHLERHDLAPRAPCAPDEEGRDILYRLAAISDVFLTNKMPSVREKLKTDVDDIRARLLPIERDYAGTAS